MRRFRFVAVAIVPVLLGCCVFISLRTRRPPDVQIVEISYVKPTGIPVFTLSNASRCAVLLSPRRWIQRQFLDGRAERTEVWLDSGLLVRPHRLEMFQLMAAPTQDVWSVDFEVTKWGLAERLHLCPKSYHPIRSRWIHQDERELLTDPANRRQSLGFRESASEAGPMCFAAATTSSGTFGDRVNLVRQLRPERTTR
jgi:hypothetical protein